MEKNHRLKTWFVFFLLASAAALAGALISQFGFDMHPCQLCLYQRWPFMIAIILLTPLLWQSQIQHQRARIVFVLLMVLFLTNAAIAGYHTGVEQGWWPGPSTCSGGDGADSLADLTEQIMGAALVSCNQPAFVFLGFSMAAWNMLYSLALGGIALWRSRN